MARVDADTELDPRGYLVSVSFERFDGGEQDAEPSERGFEVERMVFDCEQVQLLAGEYGFSEASDSHLPESGACYVWFRSTSPRVDRAHIELGESRFFDLHLHEVDGREPTAADLQRIGDYLGITFANRVREDDLPERPKP